MMKQKLCIRTRLVAIKLSVLLILLVSCSYNQNKRDNTNTQNKKVVELSSELKSPFVIQKDFSIQYLKIGQLTYSEFDKINKTHFEKSKSQSIACGDDIAMWSSTIDLKNDSIGLSIEFSSQWEENTEEKEEVLYLIKLNKPGGKFYNQIEIGKSNQNDVKNKFGEPKAKEDCYMFYIFDDMMIQLFFDKNGILAVIQIRKDNSFLYERY